MTVFDDDRRFSESRFTSSTVGAPSFPSHQD